MTDYRVTSVSLTMTLADSTTLNIGNNDIILGSLSVSEASSSSTEFSIGTAISKRLSFQLKNFNDEYSTYDFNDAQIVATIIADADRTVEEANGIVSGFAGTMGSDSVVTLTGASMDANGIVTMSGTTTTDNYTLGVFYVVEKPNYNGGTITFNALDGLYKTDRDYTTALTFPATLLQIYNELCTNCGLVPVQATIPNANYSVPVKPNLDATTAADMLCYIAQVSGTFAQMDSQGRLELKRYGGTSHALSETFSMEVDTDDVVITGVKVTECFDETDTLKRQTVLNGTAAYALTIAENPLIGSGKAQAVADFLTGVYVGMQFRPLRITVPTNPEVHVGDGIVFTDYKGNTYSTYATEVEFSTNAPTTIAMNAASPERNSAVRYSAEAKALAESKRLVDNEKTARELAIEAIEQQIAGAGGMYETTVAQPGGGSIYYLHNKPTLAESTTILRIDDTGIYISNDGGQTYPLGLDYSGTEILNKIYAIGIDADYITTGSITSAQSGFGFDLDNGTGNIGGWEINSNYLGKSASWEYPGHYFTSADSTAAASAAVGNCTAAEYKYALEHYDVNMDGIISSKDTSRIVQNVDGTALSYSRFIKLAPSDIVPIEINNGNNYTFISSGNIGFGDSNGYASVYNSGNELHCYVASAGTPSATLLDGSGNTTFPGTVSASKVTWGGHETLRHMGVASDISTDFNDITYPGLYWTNGTTMTNGPASYTWRQMIVNAQLINGTPTGPITQMIFDPAGSYVRKYAGSPATWSAWTQFFTTAGGTLTGALTVSSGNIRASAGNIWAGTDGAERVAQSGVVSAAGILRLQANASTTASKTIYVTNSAGTGATIVSVDQNNAATFYGNATTATTATTATVLSPTGAAAYTSNANGNFVHKRDTATDTWNICKNDASWTFQVVWETGVVNIASTGDYRKNGTSIVPIKGGNASSGYIRFPNIKIQIAWKKVTWTGAITTAWGNSYESTAVISLGNWSTAFSEEPRVAMGATSSAGTAGTAIEFYGKPTSSAAGSVYLFRPTSMTSQTWWVYVIGIGAYS